MGAKRKGQAGLTLIEIMVAIIIGCLAFMGYFQLYGFGAVAMDRQGWRRQAAALMEGELEYWRARFDAAGHAPVKPAETEPRRKSLKLEPEGPEFTVLPELSTRQRAGRLAWQTVSVRVVWRRGEDSDTVGLETRMYAR